HQIVRQHELRRADEVDRQSDDLATGLRHLDLDARLALGETFERPAKTLSTRDRLLELDLGFVTGPALKVDRADQRAVDARRRNLKPVAPIHWIVNVQKWRDRVGDRFAVLNRHRPVRTLRHDLEDGVAAAHQPNQHEAIPHASENRLYEVRNAGGCTTLGNETCFFRRTAQALHPCPITISDNARSTYKNKKSGPCGPTLRVEMIMSDHKIASLGAPCKYLLLGQAAACWTFQHVHCTKFSDSRGECRSSV